MRTRRDPLFGLAVLPILAACDGEAAPAAKAEPTKAPAAPAAAAPTTAPAAAAAPTKAPEPTAAAKVL